MLSLLSSKFSSYNKTTLQIGSNWPLKLPLCTYTHIFRLSFKVYNNIELLEENLLAIMAPKLSLHYAVHVVLELRLFNETLQQFII